MEASSAIVVMAMTEDQRIKVSCQAGHVTWAIYVIVSLLFPPHDGLLPLMGQGLLAGMAVTGILGLVLSRPRLLQRQTSFPPIIRLRGRQL